MAMKAARQSDREIQSEGEWEPEKGEREEGRAEADWQPDEDVNVAASSIGTFDF